MKHEDSVRHPAIKDREEEVALYAAIIEHAQAGIGIIQDGYIIFANPYLTHAFGYGEGEILGEKARRFIHPDDYSTVKKKAAEMLAGLHRAPYEYRLLTKRGDYRHVMEVVTSITYQRRPAVLTSTIDVTELREAERHLNEARDVLLLTERLAAVGSLAAGVTHEILNPLNIIAVYLQMMEDPELKPEEREFMIATCRRQVERIVKITKDLNQFARVHEHTMEELDAEELMESVLSLMAVPLRHGQVEVVRKYERPFPPLRADRNAIGQVMINIISNAIEAMAEKERKILEIGIKESKEGGRRGVRLTFSDNGPGIPVDQRERIFDPFYTTKEVGKGTGMGLAVAYGIVKEHGGEIKIEGNVMGGATFIVDLPVGNKREGR